MTSCFAVTQRVLDAMQPGLQYQYRDLRSMDCLRGCGDHQIRNALISLQNNGRILKRGARTRYRYALNPNPPPVRAGAATVAAPVRATHGETMPAISPTWPAVKPAALFDRAPRCRIAAHELRAA